MSPFLNSLFLNIKMPSSSNEAVSILSLYMLTKEYANKYVTIVSDIIVPPTKEEHIEEEPKHPVIVEKVIVEKVIVEKVTHKENLQHYPPDSFGNQDNYTNFTSGNPTSKNGKELYCPEGGRVRGHAVASTWEPRSGSEGLKGSEDTSCPQPGSREAALREPGVPPKNWISPKQSDTLFWCLYSIHYGYNDYLQVGRNYGIRLLEVKKQIGEWVNKNQGKMKQTNYKITKASVQEIMSDCLTSPRDTTPLSLLAYLSHFNMNVFIMNDTEKLAIKFIGCVDSENPTYLIKKDSYGKFKIRDEPMSNEDIASFEQTCFILDSYEKPLKSISNYKVDELEALAKKMGVYEEGKKYKKADLYGLVYEACKFSMETKKDRR